MIDFTEEQLDRYLEEDPGGPVAMLNLLRFKPEGGEERYFEYAAAIAEVGERAGLRRVYIGRGAGALVAGGGQEGDMVAISQHPSRQGFADMIRSPEYQAAKHLRTEALVEAALQP